MATATLLIAAILSGSHVYPTLLWSNYCVGVKENKISHFIAAQIFKWKLQHIQNTLKLAYTSGCSSFKEQKIGHALQLVSRKTRSHPSTLPSVPLPFVCKPAEGLLGNTCVQLPIFTTEGNEVTCSILARTGLTLVFVRLNLFVTFQTSTHAMLAVVCHLTTATLSRSCQNEALLRLQMWIEGKFHKYQHKTKTLLHFPHFKIHQNLTLSSASFLGRLPAISPLQCLHWRTKGKNTLYNWSIYLNVN